MTKYRSCAKCIFVCLLCPVLVLVLEEDPEPELVGPEEIVAVENHQGRDQSEENLTTKI